MIDKKQKLLKKYLDKKKQYAKRDDLFKQLVEISGNANKSSGICLIKNKAKKIKKKAKQDNFEESLFNEVSSETLSESTASESVHSTEASTVIPQILPEVIGDEDPIRGKLLSKEINIACVPEKKECVPESWNVINAQVHQESFPIERCENRLDSVQEQRRKLSLFYEEAEIVSQIKKHVITFIQGDTGCGKTTQIPQFLLENGFRSKGIIGMTQPRRLAATSIAARINCELNEPLCGYKIKYESNVTDATRIKVLTEGVLFREIQSDFLLSKYAVIILDEVHERTVAIDILIGLLSKIVRLRLDQGNPLRLVLMSATVAVDDFKGVLGDFHVINLHSKSHKVSVFYEDRTEDDYLSAIQNKVVSIVEAETATKKKKKVTMNPIDTPETINNDATATILVFLPSKEDIYALKSRLDGLDKDIKVIPLHSALSKEEQSKVYEKYDSRKVVLATNIAETSLTIEDVVFVIDSGRVKYKIRDEHCTKYQVGMIAKSSAKQRMGRTGRCGPGVCFRIYSGATYESLNEKSIPQILLEPIDSILLQLKVSGVEEFAAFPLITPVDKEAVLDATTSLQGIGALDHNGLPTALGKELARYAIPPRYARLLCIPGTARLRFHLAFIAAILNSGVDMRRSAATSEYFANETSDPVVYLKVCYAYHNAVNKKAFARKLGLSLPVLQEIFKLAKHLIKIASQAPFPETYILTQEDKLYICKALFTTFSSRIAVNSGHVYIYKDGELAISKDSITVTNENIVFDYIACGKNRDYAKNITIVDKSWFKTQP